MLLGRAGKVLPEPKPAHLGTAGSDVPILLNKLQLDEWNKYISELL